MKILVAVKRVVDANIKIRAKSDESAVELTNVKMAMNPFCEIAVEEAVRLKEQVAGTEIVVVTIGVEKAQEQLRSALALGADRGILIRSDMDLEPLAVAKLLEVLVKDEKPDLIILGKQSIDSDNNQVGQMLSALCELSQGTFVFNLSLESKGLESESAKVSSILVSRETDEGEQTLRLKLPAVITTDLRLNVPRYTKLPDIMKAKKKTIEITTPIELGVSIENRLTTLSITNPEPRKPGMMLTSVTDLVDQLRADKVI